jgi:Na+/melibiose symporter-like transporter
VDSARLGLATRLAYGAGGIATAVKDAAVVHFLLIFYTQVVGLSGALFGVAAMIGQVVDAVIDPVIGTWSDNTRSRLGRRHPFMLAAALPYALGFVLLFHPPAGLSSLALFGWATALLVAVRALLATFAIPHSALGAELSTDYDERTRIAGDRTVMAWLGGILLPAFAYTAIFTAGGASGDPRLAADNYLPYALLSAGVILASTLLSSLGTWRQIPGLPMPRERRALRLADPFRDVLFALRNANFRRVFAALLFSGGVTGVSTMFTALTWLYFWEFETRQTMLITVSSVLPTLFAFAVMTPLSRRFEKRTLYFATMLVLIVNALWFNGGRLLGLLPENGTAAIFALALLHNFVAVAALVVNGSVWPSIIADIADEYEVEHGERKDGVFFAALAFGLKVPQGLGNVLGGFLIGWAGVTMGMQPGSVPDAALFRLGLVAGPFVGVALLLPLVAMARYDITRRRHGALRVSLDARAVAERDSAT